MTAAIVLILAGMVIGLFVLMYKPGQPPTDPGANDFEDNTTISGDMGTYGPDAEPGTTSFDLGTFGPDVDP